MHMEMRGFSKVVFAVDEGKMAAFWSLTYK
jgi:hypothetical protein